MPTISVPAGSIALTGMFVAVSFIGPTAGAITVTGQAPRLGIGIGVPKASISITGQAPTVAIGGAVPVGSISLTGLAPRLAIGLRVPAGTLTLTGQVPTATASSGMGVGEITLTGLAPRLLLGIPVGAGSIELTGLTPVVGRGIQVGSATLDVTGLAPALGLTIGVPVGEITITGIVPAVFPPGPIPIPAGEIALTGLAPSLGLGIRIPAGTITVEGLEPVNAANIEIPVPAGQIEITGLGPGLGFGIRVPAGEIVVAGRIPTLLDSSTSSGAPDNIDAANARNLRPFDVLQIQQTDSGGTTYGVWYYFVAEEGDKVINVTAYGDATTYRPNLSVWTGDDPNSLSPWPVSAQVFAQNRPLQFPVVPGETYYIQIEPVGNPAPAILHITGRSHVEQAAPVGSILINNDTGGFEAAILSAADGDALRYLYPFPAGETGDALPTGEILISDEFDDFDLKLYDGDGETIIAEGILPSPVGAPRVRAQRVAGKFYAADSGNGSIITVGVDGTVTSVATLPQAGVTALAANNDETILYLSGQGGSLNSEIKQWDLVNGAFLSDLVAEVTGYLVADILVLQDGRIAVLYFKSSSPKAVLLRVYDEAGATLVDLTFTSVASWTSTIPRMNVGIDDPDSVWVFTHPTGSELGQSRLYNISTDDGSTINTWLRSDYETGFYQPGETDVPIDFFGMSFSCPILLIQEEIGGEEPEPEPEPEEPTGDVEPTVDTGSEFHQFFDSVCVTIERRLGDPDHRIWSAAEVDNYLAQAVKEMCTYTRLVWDWVYPEDLPRGFSFNHPWELEFIDGSGEFVEGHGYLFNWLYGQRDGMGDGQANYTFADERRFPATLPNGAETHADEDLREGWARHTFPDEIPFLYELGAAQQHATADLPHRLTELERSLWDKRTIDATNHRVTHHGDTRYEIERGEVYGYTWRKDGVRTFRKIRVPAELASTYTIDGMWGIARDLTDVVPSNTEMEGTWGIPRIVPSHHPIGPFFTYRMWGTVRRFFNDRKNVRVEHWRIPFLSCLDSELPPRYRHYLIYYAMWRCLTRQGPGQDFKLGGWYKGRWDVALARIKRRIERQDDQRTGRMGGPDGSPPRGAPPRPKLPWQYGSKLR